MPAEAIELACERGWLESQAQFRETPSEPADSTLDDGGSQATPKLRAFIYHQRMPELDSGAMLLSFPHGDWLHQT